MSTPLHSRAFTALVLSFSVIGASPGDSPADPEAGVSYDLRSKSVVTETSLGVWDAAASDGTGETAADFTLSEDELSSLGAMKGFYAPYEIREGRRDANGNFVPFSVIEKDGREVVTDTTKQPARAVVQIEFSKEGLAYGCTGAMISADTVLTAGHCVFSDGAWHKDFAVYPARNGGVKPFGRCGATTLYTLRGWVTSDTSFDPRLYDLGAIRLDCRVGDSTGWFALSLGGKAATRQRTRLSGYPCDKTPSGKQWLSVDRVRALSPLKIFYENDTYGCMSGAPVFVGSDMRHIAAIHTNGVHGTLPPWNANNAATRLTAVRIQRLAGWMDEGRKQ
jgi:V8-like Glu-specific endopeptidase